MLIMPSTQQLNFLKLKLNYIGGESGFLPRLSGSLNSFAFASLVHSTRYEGESKLLPRDAIVLLVL